MYVVEYCPEELFRPGATFSATSFDFTLEIGGWLEGMIFAGRGRRFIIQNGQAVELDSPRQRDGERSSVGLCTTDRRK
jgi:hypothetical protein